METYTIDNETNNITAHGSTAEAEAVTGVERFSTAAEFAELVSNWPSDRLVEIWNGLPGFTPDWYSQCVASVDFSVCDRNDLA